MPLQVLEAHIGQQSNACTLISVAVMYAILSTKDEPSFDAMSRNPELQEQMRQRVNQAHLRAEAIFKKLLQTEVEYKQLFARISIQLASDAEAPSEEAEAQRRQSLQQLETARNSYLDLLSQLSDASDSSILLERNIGIGNGLLGREALKFFSSRYLPSSATALKPFELGPQTEVSVTDKIDVRQTCKFLLLELSIRYKNSDGVLTPKELGNFYAYSFKHFEAMGVLGKLATLQTQHDSDEALCRYWQDLTLDRFIEWVNTSATHAAPTPSFADAISALPPNRGMTILVHAHTISVTRKGDVYYGYDSWTGRLVYSNDSREIVDWVTGSPNFQAHRPQILTISQWTPTFLAPAPSESESADATFTSSSSSTDMSSASHSTTRSPHEPPSATPPSPPNERNPSSAPTPHPLTTSQPGPSPVSGGHVATARQVFEPRNFSSRSTLPTISRSSPRGGPGTRSRAPQPGPGSASPRDGSPLSTPISPTLAQTHTSPRSQPEELPSFDARRQVFEPPNQPSLLRSQSERHIPRQGTSATREQGQQLTRARSERILSSANTENQWRSRIHEEIRAESRESSGVLPGYAQALQAYLGALEAFFHNPENNQRDFTILMPADIEHLRELRQAAEVGLTGDLRNYPVLKQWLLDARMVEKYLLINTSTVALQGERESSEASASVPPSTSTSLPDVTLTDVPSSDVAAYQSAQAALEAMLRDETESQLASNGKYVVALSDVQRQRRNQHSPYAWQALLRGADALANAIRLLLRGSDASTGEALKQNAERILTDLSGKLDQLTSVPGALQAQYASLKQQVERVLAELRRPMDIIPLVADATPLIEDMAPSPEGVTALPPASGGTGPSFTSSAHINIRAQEMAQLPDGPETIPAGTGTPVNTSSATFSPIPHPSVTILEPSTLEPSEDASPFGSPLRPVSPATTPISVSSLPFHETSSPSSSLLPPAPVVSTITPIPVIPSPSVPSASPPSSPAFVRLGSPPPLFTPPPPLSDTGTTSLSGVVPTPVVNTPSPAHAAGYIPIGQTGTSGSGGETSQTPDEVWICAEILAKVAPLVQQEARQREEEERRAEAERQRQEQERQRAEEEAARQREAARLQAERQRAEQERQRAEAERQRIAEEEEARRQAEEEARRRMIPQPPPSPEPGQPVPFFTTTTLTEQPATVEITAPGSPARLEIDDDDLALIHIDDDKTATPIAAQIATPTLDDLLERFRYHIAMGNFNVFDIDENNPRAPGNSFSRFTVTPDSQDAGVHVITYQYGKGIRKALLSGANALRGTYQFNDAALDDMARMPGNEPRDAIRDETVKVKLVQRRVSCVIENTDEKPASSISRMQLAFELIAAESPPGNATLLRSAAVIKADGYQGDDKFRELARAATQAICRGVLPIMPPQELQAVCTWIYRHDNNNYSGFVHALTTMALEIRRLDQGSRHIKDFITETYKAMRPASNSLLSPNIHANDPIGMLIADYKRISSAARKPMESTQADERQALTM